MIDENAKTLLGYPLRRRQYKVAGRTFTLVGPDNHDSLIDAPAVLRRFEQDEFLPYWAEIWPSSLLLADAVAGWKIMRPNVARRPTVLDLGCGLGLISLVADWRGYSVIAADYVEDALAFVQRNAIENGLTPPVTRMVDWRARYPDLRVDRIVAADVLYETRNLRPIAEFIEHHLVADGFALIADSYRTTAEAFESIARHCGLSVEIDAVERPGDRGPLCGRLFTLRRR